MPRFAFLKSRNALVRSKIRPMDLAAYRTAVERIPCGKRLPTSLYVYRSQGAEFGLELNALLAHLAGQFQIGPEFNVLKFRWDELKISFLSYPGFFELAHPALQQSITIDLASAKVRRADYSQNPNPPILHRKETLLPAEHPRRPEFESLTRAEEDAGLYRETTTIGFRLNWEQLLRSKGVTVQGHVLRTVRQEPAPAPESSQVPEIERHKTALTRYDLSKPVKSLLEYGLLRPGTTLFDYGCGQGADVNGLRSLGYEAEGWDPVHRPSSQKRRANIVNLGYVLNVIENPAERIEALVDAYRHSTRLLVVSALISETVEIERAAAFGDGVLTKRNTFQKYFEQQELQQFIEDALEITAVPVALGVFYVFRDPAEQQDFLSARTRRRIDWTQISGRLGLGAPKDRWTKLYQQHKELLDEFGPLAIELGRFPTPVEFERLDALLETLGSLKRALRAFVEGSGGLSLVWSEIAARFGIGIPAKAKWKLLYQKHKVVLDAFWRSTLELGRMPGPEEFPRFVDLCQALGSPKRALNLLLRQGGSQALEQSTEARRRDLLVYLAMSNLRKRVPFGHLSPGLRLDVREFFGNYQRALEKGLELLYAAGDSGEIELACENLTFGWQDAQALYLHRSLVDQSPPVLRAYVGCATTLFGDVTQADVVKLHKLSGKVTFLLYDDFETKSLPELRQRIKVNLRTRWVQVFDHSAEGQLLYFKERLLSSDHPKLAEMQAFSAKLRKLGIPEQGLSGPSKTEFQQLLAQHGLNGNLNRKRFKQARASTEFVRGIEP
jgi:hypothetical protein